MLSIIHAGNSMPVTYPVDLSAEFEPGMVAQLKLMGNDIVAGVSDGTAPLGIIDEVRSKAFTKNAIDEIVIINTVGVQGKFSQDGYYYYTVTEAKQELANPNIIPASFVADYEGLTLNPRNGLVVAPPGLALNYDQDGDGIPDSIKTIVSYTYKIPSIPGDDTTVGTGRMTIWYQRAIFQTDQFDPVADYAVNATLFVNAEGKFTTQQLSPNHPGVAIVLGPPTSSQDTLDFMWL